MRTGSKVGSLLDWTKTSSVSAPLLGMGGGALVQVLVDVIQDALKRSERQDG